MADLTTQVQTDIENAKMHKCIEVEIIDDMISADFRSSIDSNSMCCGDYVHYDKIFKTWKEFNDYADSFFKL